MKTLVRIAFALALFAGPLYAERVTSLAVNPSDPDVLYAGTDAGVYKSVDGGESWFRLSLPESLVQALAVSPSDPDILYVSIGALPTVAGVFRSTDAGETWTQVNRGLPPPPPFCGCGSLMPIFALAVDPANAQVVYAGTFQGVYKTRTGGERWFPSNQGMGDAAAISLAIDPTFHNRIYAATGTTLYGSTNRGASWTALGGSDLRIQEVVVHPRAPRTLYAATLRGVVKSTDRGLHWRPVNGGLPAVRIFTLVLDASVAGRDVLYVGTEIGVFKSGDGGVTWRRASLGMGRISISALAIHPDDSDILWAGGAATGPDTGLYKTENEARRWRLSSEGLFIDAPLAP
ncbi:MAG TPA: hypothetical protein VF756_30435 [Thermoanaerobaculia bacterium]